tara:strand:+ start:3843 stop:5168 length:1326 start_codon:yes stop_codon:yes gene_type:complete
MPQMGESITEGTVSKWLKKIGDKVERDEPILEISTDKVDAEIPSPQSGTLVEVKIQEGETVEVGTVMALIDTEGGDPVVAAVAEVLSDSVQEGHSITDDEESSSVIVSEPTKIDNDPPEERGVQSSEERLRTSSTPVVRRIAEENGVDIRNVPGTGHAGRVTKQDIISYLDSDKSKTQAPVSPSASPPSDLWDTFYREVQHPEYPIRDSDRVEPMDKIRRITADHMVLAKRVAPHVHSLIEIDFSSVDRIRSINKAQWVEQGVRISYTAFVAWACSRLLRSFPNINGTVSGGNIVHRGNVNIGVAVDLNPGLIVPVIHDTDNLSLVGIGKKIIDLAERARSRKLNPSEIQGATFSITNPGVLGTLVGIPVIPKGTSAILGMGSIEKRTVVIEDPDTGSDTIAIRKRSLFSLGYDHRLVDGADAARFISDLRALLEDFPGDA